MIKETVLLVEDDEQLPLAWKAAILESADSATDVVIARSYEEALVAARTGQIAYAVVDLGLPRRQGGDVVEIEPDDVCSLGFSLLRSLQEWNPSIEITVASRFSDNARVADLKNQLVLQEDSPIRRVFNKNADPDYLEKILEDTQGLGELMPYLEKAGVRAIHPLERRLARRLWQKAGVTADAWPMPILVVRGDSRAGKGAWARAFVQFVNARRPSHTRPEPAPLDLGQLTGRGGGDSTAVDLFGARNYQGISDCAGIFERATRYKGRAGQRTSQRGLASASDVVDYHNSGVACLDELGNLPVDLQPMLLAVLDSNPRSGGRVTPAGGSGRPIAIGCSIVFMTNSELESRVAKSEIAEDGELREDLFRRLRAEPDGWLTVPSLSELGPEVVFEHLDAALRADGLGTVDVSDSARLLLRTAVEQDTDLVTMETIRTVVEQFRRTGGARLTDEHVLPAVQRVDKHRERRDSTSERVWTLEDFTRSSIVAPNEKQYYILQILLEHLGEDLRPERVRQYLDESPELKAVRAENNWKPYKTVKTMSQALSVLRKKVNEEQVVARSGISLVKRGWGAIRTRTNRDRGA